VLRCPSETAGDAGSMARAQLQVKIGKEMTSRKTRIPKIGILRKDLQLLTGYRASFIFVHGMKYCINFIFTPYLCCLEEVKL